MSQVAKYRYQVTSDVIGWEVGQVLELDQPLDRAMLSRVRVLESEAELEAAVVPEKTKAEKNDKRKSKAVPKKSKDKPAK